MAATVTGFSVEVTSQALGQLVELVRESGTATRLTPSGFGAILYTSEGIGQVRSAALLEKRLKQIDPTARVRRVSNI